MDVAASERRPIGLSVSEVMAEVGLSRFTVSRLIAERRLLAVRAGRRIIVSRRSLEAFMAGEGPGDGEAQEGLAGGC